MVLVILFGSRGDVVTGWLPDQRALSVRADRLLTRAALILGADATFQPAIASQYGKTWIAF